MSEIEIFLNDKKPTLQDEQKYFFGALGLTTFAFFLKVKMYVFH